MENSDYSWKYSGFQLRMMHVVSLGSVQVVEAQLYAAVSRKPQFVRHLNQPLP